MTRGSRPSGALIANFPQYLGLKARLKAFLVLQNSWPQWERLPAAWSLQSGTLDLFVGFFSIIFPGRYLPLQRFLCCYQQLLFQPPKAQVNSTIQAGAALSHLRDQRQRCT